MKKYCLIVVLLSLYMPVVAQTERLEIPVALHDGSGKGMAAYGMTGLSFIGDRENYVWKDLIPEPKGLPDNLTEVRMGVEFLNQPQFIYQHTKAGQIAEGYMQEAWLENYQFTETPMRCYLLFAEGIDPEGNRWFVVDQNNNRDLSDDTYFCADSLTFEKGRKEIRVVFDTYIKGEVVPQERTFYIGYNPHHRMYFGKVAEYATCELGGETYMLSPYGHNYMAYEDFEVIPLTTASSDEQTPFAEQPARKGEYIQVGEDWYCFKGIAGYRQMAILDKEHRPQTEIYSMQTGFRPYPFSGIEFTSKDSLMLDRYKGKSLLLMIWSPGCGSCIEKLAAMNEIYASLNPDKASVLGLAIHTNEEHLAAVKEEHAVTFPLMTGEHDRMHEAYFRLSTPTFLLINPEGVIVKKTLHIDEIKNLLSEI